MPVTLLDPEITNTSIRLNWRAPNPNYGTIRNYHVYINKEEHFTKQTTYLFSKLAPGTKYNFKIITENYINQEHNGGGPGQPVKTSYTTLADRT